MKKDTSEIIRGGDVKSLVSPDYALATQSERVGFVGALREIVGRHAPRNKVGTPMVSDYDMIWASDDERAEAWRTASMDAANRATAMQAEHAALVEVALAAQKHLSCFGGYTPTESALREALTNLAAVRGQK